MKQNKGTNGAAWRDLLIICFVAVVLFAVAARINVFERFMKWSQDHESWQADEMLMMFVLLAFALGVFAWRRWRELSAEVTRRRVAEESLRQRDASYRQIVEDAGDLIYKTDVSGRFVFCNPTARKLLKYSEAEMLGKNYLELIKPDCRAEAQRFYREQIADRVLTTYLEIPVIRKDGVEILIGQNVQLLLGGGEIVGLQAVARDMTQHRRAEEALRRMEEYRNLFRLANDSILVLDAAEGTVLDVNNKACETYGIARQELIGRSVETITQDPAAARWRLEQLRSSEKLEEFETTHIRADGTLIHFLINPSVIEYRGRKAILSINRDITERKRAQEEQGKLQAERDQLLEQLQLQIEVMPMAFVLTDATNRTTYWNPAAERMFGFTKEEILGTCGHKLLVQSDSQKYVEEIFARIASGESLSSSGENITKDGRLITCEWYTAPLKKADGTFLGIMSMAQDVTGRKEAEVALRESEERYHRLVELSPDGIIVHIDGVIDFVNGAGAKLIGAASTSQLIGKSIYDLVLPEFREILKGRVARMCEGDLLAPAELKGTRFDGTEIDCEILSVPFAHGDQVAIQAVVRDITERKRAEQSLQEANTRALKDYERLVERIAALGQTLGNARDLGLIFRALREFAVLSVPCDGMLISLYDSQSQTRSAAYCWADEQEFDPAVVANVPVRDGVTGRAIGSGTLVIDNNFRQQFSSGKEPLVVGECTDAQTPQSALSAPMTFMGRTVGCVEIQSYRLDAYKNEHATAIRMAANLAATAVENIRLIERKQAKEEQLRQSQKMEAIGHLAGGVAHDFNNLLTVIAGYSDLGLRRLPADAPVRKNFEEIKKAGLRAASLTSQLLAFSRKQVIQPKVLDLNALVANMDKMLRRLIGENIDLITVPQSELGQIKADPGQIEQLIMNLVVNARDAIPTGGKITIETGHAYLDGSYANKHLPAEPGHYVRLSVSDTGVGMDAATQKLIFEPFFTTKEVGKGTGLGLSTVYGIVKQNGGSIWVYSEVGKGTTFKIYLPRVDEVKDDENRVEIADLPRGRETVLLVEDEEMVRELSRDILEEAGYQVVVATNGSEGLKVCQEFKGEIDLMITDVVMPEMSGRELAEEVAELRPDTKVIFMSGYTDDAIVRHGILEDNVSFIQKPFLADALALKAREVLDQSLPVTI